MKHNLHSLPAFIIYILALVITFGSSCRENTIINSKVSPTNNTIGVYSVSLPCITHTYFDDTITTSTNIGGLSIYQGVGSITDSFFGTMTGATYFQVVPYNTDPTFFTTITDTIDSAILVLPYSGFTYGDTLTQTLTQTYQVFYMLDSIGYNSPYSANSNKAIDVANPLSDPATVNIYHLRDSVGLYPNTLPVNYPGLRIKLKLPALLNHLQAAQKALGGTNPIQDFLNTFNGVCVRVADTRQSTTAIPYFQLNGADPYSEAGILLYHHPVGTTADTTYESYYFSTTLCAHFNNITKTYSQYPINGLLHSTAANDQVIALQNQPGASIDVIIPGIKSLPAGVINKAELQFTLIPSANSGNFSAPERLYPIGIANSNYPASVGNNISYNIADRYPLTSLTPLTVMDGYLHFNFNGSTRNTFTIDIPREVMSSIAAKNDTLHLHINGTQDFYGAYHMVAGGGKYGVDGTADTLYRPKLFVVYSKLVQ